MRTYTVEVEYKVVTEETATFTIQAEDGDDAERIALSMDMPEDTYCTESFVESARVTDWMLEEE